MEGFDWAVEMLKQVPALAVLAWIVRYGVLAWGAAQTQKGEADKATLAVFVSALEARDGILTRLHEDMRQDARETRATLSGLQGVMGEVSAGNVALLEAIRKIDGGS